MTRCPFSLSRLAKVTRTGQVVYKAEKWDRHPACLFGPTGWKPIPRPEAEFPDPRPAGIPGRVHATRSTGYRNRDGITVNPESSVPKPCGWNRLAREVWS